MSGVKHGHVRQLAQPEVPPDPGTVDEVSLSRTSWQTTYRSLSSVSTCRMGILIVTVSF